MLKSEYTEKKEAVKKVLSNVGNEELNNTGIALAHVMAKYPGMQIGVAFDALYEIREERRTEPFWKPL